MGQIIGSAAKPKRCNLSKLSQLGTPAAGEYILVSSDNSMNAAGQGNFDAYIVGDGKTAATQLKLKRIDGDLEGEVAKIEIELNGIYVYSNTLIGGYTQLYYELPCFDFSKVGKVYHIEVSVESGVVWLYKSINGVRNTTAIATLRNGNTYNLTIEDGMDKIEIRSGEANDIHPVITITTEESIDGRVNDLEEFVGENKEMPEQIAKQTVYSQGTTSQTVELPIFNPNNRTYKPIYGLDYSAVGEEYKLTFAIANTNAVQLFKTVNGTRTLIGYYRNGNTVTIVVEQGMSKLELMNGYDTPLTVTVNVEYSKSLNNRINDAVQEISNTEDSLNAHIDDFELCKDGEEYLNFQWVAGSIVNGEEVPSSGFHRSPMFTMDELLFAKLVLSNSSFVDCDFYDDSDSYVGFVRKSSDWVIVPENARYIKVRFVVQNSHLDDVSIILSTNIGRTVKDNSFNIERHGETLAKNVGLIRDVRFVRGNIATNIVYPSSNTISTLSAEHIYKAITAHLSVGDIVGLDNYDNAKIRLVKFVNGEYNSLTDFFTSEYIVDAEGDYAFVLRKIDESSISDDEIDALGSLFYIKTVDGYAKKIDTIETELWDDLPSYFKAQIDSKTNTIKTALDTAGRNKCAFIFVTDQHWDSNDKHSPAAVRYLTKTVPTIKTVFGGGDITSNGQARDKVYPQFADYQKKMDFLEMKIMQAPGNHDWAYQVNPPQYWTDGERFIGSMGQMVNNSFTVIGTEEGSYHFYYDSPFERTRIIYLSTGNYDACATRDQLEFLRDALLSTPEGWHIIIMAHILANPVPPDPENPDEWNENAPTKRGFYVTEYTYKFLDMADAYNNRATYSVLPYASQEPVECDFTNGKATFEGAIGGHLHADVWGKTHGNHGFIITDTDSRSPYGNYPYVQGTVSEQCVSVVIFDFDNRNIKMVRIGRGVDMTVSLDNPAPMEYEGVPLQKS